MEDSKDEVILKTVMEAIKAENSSLEEWIWVPTKDKGNVYDKNRIYMNIFDILTSKGANQNTAGGLKVVYENLKTNTVSFSPPEFFSLF